MGLPIVLSASEGNEAISRYSTPYVIVQLQLSERSLFHLSAHSDSAPLTPLLDRQPIGPHRVPSHPLDYLIALLADGLQRTQLRPLSSEAEAIAFFSLSKMNVCSGRPGSVPLLLLSPSHLHEISADYIPLASLQIPEGAMDLRSVYPIPVNGLKPSLFLKRVSGTQTQLSSLPVPLPRQLTQLTNRYSAHATHSITILTKSKAAHSFLFATPSLLFEFLQADLKVRSIGSLTPNEEFSVLCGSQAGDPSVSQPYPCTLTFTTLEGRVALHWKGTEDPLQYSHLFVEDIEELVPSTFPPFPTNVSIDLSIPNILNPDIRSSTIVFVSVMTNSGQHERCIFSCDSNERGAGTIRLFCRSEELATEAILLAVHIQESATKEIQTIGETEVPLSSLVHLDTAGAEGQSFLSQVPRALQITLRPPRRALM
jgi:hypothetical protein